MGEDCNWVIHPGSGKILPRRTSKTDPIFGGSDFLTTHKIDPSSDISIYRVNGAPTAEDLARTAEEYGVSPEIIAAILQYENNPEHGLAGIMRRRGKMILTPLLQRVSPDHDSNVGYSQGLANIKPSTADYIVAYFEKNYPGSSIEDDPSYLNPGGATQFTAAYARMAIDTLYWPGYEGPMSLEGLTLIIAHHHTGTVVKVPWGNYEFGPALLMSASEGNATLIFYRVPKGSD